MTRGVNRDNVLLIRTRNELNVFSRNNEIKAFVLFKKNLKQTHKIKITITQR